MKLPFEQIKRKVIIKEDTPSDPQYGSNPKERSAKDLLDYCSLDTLAMVKIWEKLKTIN